MCESLTTLKIVGLTCFKVECFTKNNWWNKKKFQYDNILYQVEQKC
jgi:hypothetical protein